MDRILARIPAVIGYPILFVVGVGAAWLISKAIGL